MKQVPYHLQRQPKYTCASAHPCSYRHRPLQRMRCTCTSTARNANYPLSHRRQLGLANPKPTKFDPDPPTRLSPDRCRVASIPPGLGLPIRLAPERFLAAVITWSFKELAPDILRITSIVISFMFTFFVKFTPENLCATCIAMPAMAAAFEACLARKLFMTAMFLIRGTTLSSSCFLANHGCDRACSTVSLFCGFSVSSARMSALASSETPSQFCGWNSYLHCRILRNTVLVSSSAS
mmetsp:Transcript_21658/g.48232  ORF Transcript_21658/g.48232 Transcript_21658/m.48232 type:complete len:237 (-) Transcript_21658:921-1631(-)